jgi:hypothetical protein
MILRTAALVATLLSVTPLLAESPKTVFRPAGTGLFDFDTGILRGRLKLDGRYQGVYPLVDAGSAADLTMPPGVFSPYRVFTTGKRFGNAARDWPTTTRLLDDGAVEVRWPAGKENPLEITGVYRLAAADTLDLELTVRPQLDLPDFELFMSSYFTRSFRASVYLKPQGLLVQKPRFVPVDRGKDDKGGYVMFPRDDKALDMIRDGRWKIPPNPVDWDARRWLAAPLVVRRDAGADITAVMMCPPDDCFAVSSPWNPSMPDGGGYRSLYLSLFGRSLKTGQEARARCRLVIGRKITDQRAVELYEAYVKQGK